MQDLFLPLFFQYSMSAAEHALSAASHLKQNTLCPNASSGRETRRTFFAAELYIIGNNFSHAKAQRLQRNMLLLHLGFAREPLAVLGLA
jgi:hypothetical protein